MLESVERWMLESDRLVCENKHNLSLNAIWDPSIYVYFNYKVNLLIGCEKIFATKYPLP